MTTLAFLCILLVTGCAAKPSIYTSVRNFHTDATITGTLQEIKNLISELSEEDDLWVRRGQPIIEHVFRVVQYQILIRFIEYSANGNNRFCNFMLGPALLIRGVWMTNEYAKALVSVKSRDIHGAANFLIIAGNWAVEVYTLATTAFGPDFPLSANSLSRGVPTDWSANNCWPFLSSMTTEIFQALEKGEFLKSPNQHHFLKITSGCDLILHNVLGHLLWQTRSSSEHCLLALQKDGDLVFWSGSEVVWRVSLSCQTPHCLLFSAFTIEDNGSLVLYRLGNGVSDIAWAVRNFSE